MHHLAVMIYTALRYIYYLRIFGPILGLKG